MPEGQSKLINPKIDSIMTRSSHVSFLHKADLYDCQHDSVCWNHQRDVTLKRDAGTTLSQFWPSISNAVPALKQRCASVTCSLGLCYHPSETVEIDPIMLKKNIGCAPRV